MKKSYLFLLMLWSGMLFSSCEKFLDAKPDQALATPTTLKDLRAILDSYQLNSLYLIAGDVMSDDYYLEEATWKALPDQLYRDTYIWGAQTYHDFDWQNGYNIIFRANVALDGLKEIPATNANQTEINTIKGTALFYRAFAMYHLLQLFTLPYDELTASTIEGLPLKLSSALEEPIRRVSLKACYDQVTSDLQMSILLLPKTRDFKTQPTKVTAFAQLARMELIMDNYKDAGLYADSALMVYNKLMDYNSLNANAANPFPLFNDEVIFQAFNTGRGGVFLSSRARVDSSLYRSYASNDLRKVLFYSKNSNGSYAFKGDYSSKNSGNLFTGIATDELYLILAESEIRQQRLSSGLAYLNSLLAKRFKTGTYVPLTAANSDEALKLVLQERRKELAFRSNVRWGDIRRLVKEPNYAITMRRNIGGQVYELRPGDLRFANLIPQNTITLSGISQNNR